MSRAGDIPLSILMKERVHQWVASAALSMLIKPIRNKLVGQYFDLAN